MTADEFRKLAVAALCHEDGVVRGQPRVGDVMDALRSAYERGRADGVAALLSPAAYDAAVAAATPQLPCEVPGNISSAVEAAIDAAIEAAKKGTP